MVKNIKRWGLNKGIQQDLEFQLINPLSCILNCFSKTIIKKYYNYPYCAIDYNVGVFLKTKRDGAGGLSDI